jgi:beta-galactosidase/beta-glucuronidase
VARSSSAGGVPVTLEINKPRPWSPVDPYLYKLTFELFENNRVVDVVDSYAGLRKIHIEGNKIFLNNKPIFLRFVLDQGYYPEGVWTAPADEQLKADIELSMAIGFNGARLHQKVFEERFHYWADRLGYLTWGEFCDWGLGEVHKIDKPVSPQGVHNHQREWREVVLRDLNHPSIITWTPFNETGDGARVNLERHRRALQETVNLTKALDPTRPVIDSSGHIHVETDIESVHDYEQDTEVFRKHYQALDPARHCLAQ